MSDRKIALVVSLLVVVFFLGFGVFCDWWVVPKDKSTIEVTTEISDQPFEVIDLGWRDVIEVKDIGGSQAVVLFRNNPDLSADCDGNNTRLAMTDCNHPPHEMYSPLITLDHKKAYILEIKINSESKYFDRVPFTVGGSYIVKMGNLPAELAKANLPR
jgi:hypothetical protein